MIYRISVILFLITSVGYSRIGTTVKKPPAPPPPKIRLWIPPPVDFRLETAASKLVDSAIAASPEKKQSDTSTKSVIPTSVSPKNTVPQSGELTVDESTMKTSSVALTTSPLGPSTVPPAIAPIGGNSTTSAPSRKSVAFSKWYPVCLFADETIGADEVNEGVKGLSDAGAKCQVNVVVFPVTIKSGYAEAPGPINQGSIGWCNVGDIGASVASALACVPHQKSADLMCNAPPKMSVSGCAQGRSGQDSQIKQWKQQNNIPDNANDGHNGGGGGTGVLASIVDEGACSNYLANHESIGHSALGWPNKEKKQAGFDIEDIGGSGAGTRTGWSPTACQRLQDVAMPNDGRWRYDENRTDYYVKAKTPIDLLSGGKLFGDPKPPPQPPKIATNKGVQDVFSQDFFSSETILTQSALATGDTVPASGRASSSELHPFKEARSSDSLPTMGMNQKPRLDPEELLSSFAVPRPPNAARGNPSPTLAVDEGASKSGATWRTADTTPAKRSEIQVNRQRGSPTSQLVTDEGATKSGSEFQSAETTQGKPSFESSPESSPPSEKRSNEQRTAGLALRKPRSDRMSTFVQRREQTPKRAPATREKGSGLRSPVLPQR